ncbi:hypothetical protein OSB04_001077 [Centaurea solstitialis]|uniref:Auxin-responsive protein n=1 Tax=Centaurea solstitialis TaxID=347529 RepID=A0AA38U2Z8_9ASTR|nr:hypothetical protein OSB04_001077 [Centaurea solstitialis]
MDVTLGLSGNSPAAGDGGGGGGVPSGGSTTEVTSCYPILDENFKDDLELGLGLSIGGGGGLKSKMVEEGPPCWSQYARILTAKDFQSLVSKPNSCSSSSSGTKRTATDSVSPPNGYEILSMICFFIVMLICVLKSCNCSVVGWPPVSKAHRMPSLANQTKSPSEELVSMAEQNKNKNRTIGGKDYCNERKGISIKKYRSVKVNMDGTLIGRKVDLNAYNSYEMLAQTLEEMFWGRRSSTEATGSSRLLDGTSEFVLTYQDKDGDCMLVGDVPWQMFLSSVKRLRIMRNSESNELSRKQRSKQN